MYDWLGFYMTIDGVNICIHHRKERIPDIAETNP